MKSLLDLAQDVEFDSRSFFVTMLPKFFGEFEDLQNEQLDKLLDLCEDEEEKVSRLKGKVAPSRFLVDKCRSEYWESKV